MNNVMFLDLDVDRLYEITYPESQPLSGNTVDEGTGTTSGQIVQKSDEEFSYYEGEGGGTKNCRRSYKKSEEVLRKNAPPHADNCNTLLQKNVPPPTSNRRTNTKNTTETTGGDYPINLSRLSNGGHLKVIDERSDEMDEKPTKAEQYRELIFDNTHLEWHLENDSPTERAEYENLVELICDVVCAEHSKPVYINSTAMEPRLVRSRFLKLTDSHIQYVMECLRKNPNHKGIESYRNYKLTCLYNAPVTMDTYYQQQVNHDLESGIWLRKE